MVPKHNWILFLGGVVGFILLATYSSYKGAIAAVESTGAKIALEEIEKARKEALSSRSVIDSYAQDIKNGKKTELLLNALKSDTYFLTRIKGDSGPKGEQGIPGPKGDTGILQDSSGDDYLKLRKNTDGKTRLYQGIGSSGLGYIQFYDDFGNSAVIEISSKGIYDYKNRQWIQEFSNSSNSSTTHKNSAVNSSLASTTDRMEKITTKPKAWK